MKGNVKTPDTLDLQKHALIGIKGMLNSLDENNQFWPFFFYSLAGKHPFVSHSEWDCHATARYAHSLTVARYMTGSTYGVDAERKVMDNFYSMLSERDGLGYRVESSSTDKMADMHDQREFLMALGTRAALLGDTDASRRFRQLCEGLRRIALKWSHPRLTDSFLYFPQREFYPDAGWRFSHASPAGVSSVLTDGGIIYPLACYFGETGDELALDLAEKFARHVMYHSSAFNPDGSIATGAEFWFGHFHVCSRTLMAIAKLGLTLHDVSYLEWVKRSFDWIKTIGSSFGWFPEIAAVSDYCEGCGVADMVEIAILLAQAGYEDYWNDAERFLRNQLVEQHLTNVDWIKENPGNEQVEKEILATIGRYVSIKGRKPPLNYITTKDIQRRSYGSFAGWATVNDFVGWERRTVMNCCTAAGVHAFYISWSNAITKRFHRTYINLLLNRESEDLKVISFLPSQGKIEVCAKKRVNVLIRIPQWVNRPDLRIVRNGSHPEPSWKRSFLEIGWLKSQETVEVNFPLCEAKNVERIGNKEYVVEWRGDTVVGIDPPGTIHPLYNR